MKCPKCHYLSFDPEPRCKNCGFSLGLAAPDLPITGASAADGPLADLELRTITPPGRSLDALDALDAIAVPESQAAAPVPEPGEVTSPQPARRIPVPRLDRPRTRLAPEERGAAAPEPAPVERKREAHAERAAAPARPIPPTTELPLFVKDMTDAPPAELTSSVPLTSRGDALVPEFPAAVEVRPQVAQQSEPVTVAALAPAEPAIVERPVARPVPVITPLNAAEPVEAPVEPVRRPLGPLDRDLLSGVEQLEKKERRKARAAARVSRLPDAAGAGRRLIAATVDGALLSGILLGLFALTLRWTSLEWTEGLTLATWPTVAFLTLVAAGYLLLFTVAAGQTPGKMLAGIRVVGAGATGDAAEPLSAGQACLRELVAVPGVLVLGLGFLPALVGAERGVHDRIASTRVVRG